MVTPLLATHLLSFDNLLSVYNEKDYYVALYWADALSKQDEAYVSIAKELQNHRSQIVEEFSKSQGDPVDLGGYFMFDAEKAGKAMNPSATLNKILASSS
jgi:isocitrate dehydrogenase